MLLILVILINVILPVVFESITDLVTNIQGYFETAINKYNELPSDSILKGDLVNELIQSVQNINILHWIK